MIEIALCIAIVAFAMVAILGVLPTGMTVQKDNRDDAVINQEGQYWLEALRSGNQGMTDLTNYVESVTVSNIISGKTKEFLNLGNGLQLTNAETILGLLSRPKVEFDDPNPANPKRKIISTNRITARVKAITGLASEKGALTNDVSFRYQVQAELIPVDTVPTNVLNDLTVNFASLLKKETNAPIGSAQRQLLQSQRKAVENQLRFLENLGPNSMDVRLVLRWPLYEQGTNWIAGGNKKTFRTRTSGKLIVTGTDPGTGERFYRLQPNTYLVNAAP